MDKGIEIIIPIHSHIKKMIGLRESIDPFYISIGKCVYSEIIFYNMSRENVEITYKKKDTFNDTLRIHINKKQIKSGRFYFTDKRIQKIDHLLKGIFESKLIEFLEDNCYNVKSHGDGNIKQNILKFMDKYGFDDNDISYEGLKKIYQRYRSRDPKKYTKNYHSLPKNAE